MTQARATQVSLDDTPWYHCVNRCVRRAFLCGQDAVSGRNYEHRRGWISDRLQQLAAIFAIDIAAYAVMSNHFHVVVHIDRQRAQGWTVEEVLQRWTQLFAGPELIRRYLSDARAGMSDAEIARVVELADNYRERLYDLSWFMRCLNEHIARQANAEDGVKGHFWEGRFKSQALLDESALLTAMAYVDLNPIRAGLAETPETSDHTAIQARIRQIAAADPAREEAPPDGQGGDEPTDATPEALPLAPLMPFDATGRAAWAIPFAFEDYLQLIDWTGRAVHPRKRGHIPDNQPEILRRLQLDPEQFIRHAHRLMNTFGTAIGRPAAMTDLCARRQTRYLRGIRVSRRLFTTPLAA